MPSLSTWLSKFNQLAANPGDIQSLQLDQISEIYNGTADVDIGTASSPVMNVLTASAVNTAGALVAYGAYNRRLYEYSAQTLEDLYVHMSDKDYLNRFATPSSAEFILLFSYEELLTAMVDTGTNNIKELMIPRYSYLTVAGHVFTMQYPILIRQMANDALQVIYDNSVASPIETLASNIVNWSVVTYPNGSGGSIRMVQMTVPMKQMAINSKLIPINYSQSSVTTVAYTNQFYYARAYSIADDGTVTEIRTTHTDQTFDPSTPTVLLSDLGGSLRIEIPQIYLSNESIGGEVRVDIYTTEGDISVDLSQYSPANYVMAYSGATTAESAYVAPLATFRNYLFMSKTTTSGGTDAKSFTELREQVMTNNFGTPVIPVMPSQLAQALTDLGYDSVFDADDILKRTSLATRSLAAPSDNSTYSGASLSVETLTASFSLLDGLTAFINNGDRATITPDMLYTLDNGILAPVTNAGMTALNAMTQDALVSAINNANYLYSPFHYVLDNTTSTFALRPYYLDSPLINSVQFVDQNETVGITVASDLTERELIRTETGWRLRIIAQSSDEWKQLKDSDVFCQIGFIPKNETGYAYLNGTQIGLSSNNERIFEFDIQTNYDIDSDDYLTLTNFSMFTDGPRNHAIGLDSSFDVFWIAAGVKTADVTTTQIDTDMGVDLLPSDALGLDRERYMVTLGVTLNNLWRNVREVPGSGSYRTYSTVVYDTYSDDVYELDANGLRTYTVGADGTSITFNLLHAKGDFVLDANGNKEILHNVGDFVLDADGNKILLTEGSIEYLLDLLLVEGVYYFATTATTVAYKESIPNTIASWVNNDLASVSPDLIEETQLFYYPKAALGNVSVLTQDGLTQTIAAQQSFVVTFFMDAAAYNDQGLRPILKSTAIQVLAEGLDSRTVSLKTIQANLDDSISDDILNFTIIGLGGSSNLTLLSMKDDADRLSIRKEAVVMADGTIGTADAVTAAYKLHTTSGDSANA